MATATKNERDRPRRMDPEQAVHQFIDSLDDIGRDEQVKFIRRLAFSRLNHTNRDKATVTHRDILVYFHYGMSNATAYRRMEQTAQRYDDIEYIEDDGKKRLLLDVTGGM